MKKSHEVLRETICAACNGTGFPKVRQPTEPGRKIYPGPCKQCLGKGRIKMQQATFKLRNVGD
jgi:DnaJ-class molecular chaperone